MPTPQRLYSDLIVYGNLEVKNGFVNLRSTDQVQETLSEFPIPIEDWRVWNAYGTLLGSAASDDLGITAGAFGTATPYVTAGDINADANASRYARFQVELPKNYVAAETLTIRFWAGLISGTPAIGTVTLDLVAYRVGSATGSNVASADLVSTSLQSINTTTMAAYDFVVDGSALNPGDILDCRVDISFTNNATARVPGIVYAQLLADTKG